MDSGKNQVSRELDKVLGLLSCETCVHGITCPCYKCGGAPEIREVECDSCQPDRICDGYRHLDEDFRVPTR